MDIIDMNYSCNNSRIIFTENSRTTSIVYRNVFNFFGNLTGNIISRVWLRIVFRIKRLIIDFKSDTIPYYARRSPIVKAAHLTFSTPNSVVSSQERLMVMVRSTSGFCIPSEILRAKNLQTTGRQRCNRKSIIYYSQRTDGVFGVRIQTFVGEQCSAGRISRHEESNII